MKNIVLERLAVRGLIGVGLLFRFDVDRGAIVGGAECAGQEGAVVAGIVPSKSALVAGVFPEADGELYRLDRLLAAKHDRLAVALDLLPAPRPQIRVPKRVCVAKRMRQSLAERTPLGLQFLAAPAPSLPGLRVFLRPVADLVPPRGAIGDLQADDRVVNGEPFLAVIGDRFRSLVKPALRLADLFR